MKSLLKYFLSALFISGCNPAHQQKDEVLFSFAFLTDIHVQPEKNGDEGFLKAIKKVNELNPDFVITGGDLVMDALGVSYGRADSLYKLYLELSSQFTMPVYNTLGNHEIYGLYRESQADTLHPEYGKGMFEKRIGKRFYSFDHKGWHFIILDAVAMNTERHYEGYIDGVQMDWLRADIRSLTPETPVVISTHMPLVTSFTQLTKGSLEGNGKGLVISNGKEVLELFRKYNLILVLQGHLHFLEDLYIDQKVHFITGGAVSGRWWNGPVSENVPEGFLLVKVFKNQVTWEYMEYEWEAVKK